MKFKKNDWCFYEFKLCQVSKVNSKGNPVEVTDGIGTVTGSNLKCLPLSIGVKNLSETFSNILEEIREAAGIMNLNYPDINKIFVYKWWEACASAASDTYIYEIRSIRDKFLTRIKELNNVTVHGIKLLRE